METESKWKRSPKLLGEWFAIQLVIVLHVFRLLRLTCLEQIRAGRKHIKSHHCVVGFKVTMRRSSILAAFTTFVSFAFQKSTFAASFVDPVNGY